MDEALERRIGLIVEFPAPDQKMREKIWKGLLPERLPLARNVTIKKLAEKELTGGLIKNVVLHAARLAVVEDAKSVEMKHFDKALIRVSEGIGLMGRRGRERFHSDGVTAGPVTSKDRDKSVTGKLADVIKSRL